MDATNESARFSWRGFSEVVGVIGVVVGLAFVGTEIRQNTLASRAQARQELAGQNWDYLLRLAEDDELAVLWSREWTVEFIHGLPPEERFKVALSTIALLTRLEGVYSQVAEGLIGEEALDYYGMVQPRFDEAGFWTIWRGARHTFRADFRDFFEQRHNFSP